MFKTLLADYSILEFIVYAVIGYAGIIFMIASILKYEKAATKDQAVMRAVWIMPSLFAISMLMFTDSDITLWTETSSTITTSQYQALNATNNNNIVTLNSTTTEVFTNSNTIFLREPVWGTFHLALFFILLIYILVTILTIFIKIGKRDSD